MHSYKHSSEPLLPTFMLRPYVFVYSFLYGVKEKLVWLRFFLRNIFGHLLVFFFRIKILISDLDVRFVDVRSYKTNLWHCDAFVKIEKTHSPLQRSQLLLLPPSWPN